MLYMSCVNEVSSDAIPVEFTKALIILLNKIQFTRKAANRKVSGKPVNISRENRSINKVYARGYLAANVLTGTLSMKMFIASKNAPFMWLYIFLAEKIYKDNYLKIQIAWGFPSVTGIEYLSIYIFIFEKLLL